jgi:hypothetical protein
MRGKRIERDGIAVWLGSIHRAEKKEWNYREQKKKKKTFSLVSMHAAQPTHITHVLSVYLAGFLGGRCSFFGACSGLTPALHSERKQQNEGGWRECSVPMGDCVFFFLLLLLLFCTVVTQGGHVSRLLPHFSFLSLFLFTIIFYLCLLHFPSSSRFFFLS